MPRSMDIRYSRGEHPGQPRMTPTHVGNVVNTRENAVSQLGNEVSGPDETAIY
jgi:hypothetical protein